MSSPVLNREQAVQRLIECEGAIRALGVARLALFGSFLRHDYLRHIVVEADYLIHRSAGLSFEAFVVDDTLRRAFVRSLEIIGEAAKRVPDDFRVAPLSVEWRAMAGMRDWLIHD